MIDLIDKYSRVDVIDWAERNIVLDYGSFDRANHPTIIDPLRSMCDMRGGIVGIIGSVQHIKTLTAQIGQLYLASVMPGRAGMYDLTENALKEFTQDKFSPLIESTSTIMDFVPDQKYRLTKFYTSTNFASIRLLSANVTASRNSKTFERVSADECWAYGDNWLSQIKDRMTSYPWQWMLFLPSSGQTAKSELDDFWNRSTQKVWHVPCDYCGEMMPYVWTLPKVGDQVPMGGMRWAAKEHYIEDFEINYTKLKESAYYECQFCGGKHYYSAGSVHNRNTKGRYIQTNKAGDPLIDMYHYNAMAHMPWPDLVEEWVMYSVQRDRGDLSGLENFIRKRLAQRWCEADYISGDKPKDSSGGYLLGEKWDVPNQFIFCTIDVQKDHYYYVIRSWALVNNVLNTRLLDCRLVITTAEIKEACDHWQIPQNRLGAGGACRVFVDGNYNTNQVQRIALDMGWMVFRGDNATDYLNQDRIRRIYSDIKPVDVFDGTGMPLGSKVGQFYFSKQSSKNRLSLLRELKDHNGELLWTYADNVDPEYIKQINSWAKIEKQKPNGEKYFDWINRNRDDHFYDCECMQVVCAAMCKSLGVDKVRKADD